MQMESSRQINAPADLVWQALNNPEVLKQCIPGCQSFEEIGPNTYKAVVSVKVGPVSATFSGKVELTNIQPPRSYSMVFEAQGGAAGYGKGTSHVDLSETENGVELHYKVESQVGGKLAQIGQRLIDGAAKSMADDFFKRFEGIIAQQTGVPSPEAESTPGTAQEAAASKATGKTPSFPTWLWIAVIISIIMILIVV